MQCELGRPVRVWLSLALCLSGNLAFAALRPPTPKPDRGHIGVSIRAGLTTTEQLGWFGLGPKMQAHKTYFVRLDDSAELYAVDGAVWPNYSWSERLEFFKISSSLKSSNWSRQPLGGRSSQYLLNAEPGRYVAVGADFIHVNALKASLPFGTLTKFAKYFTGAFSSEMVTETEVVVSAGEWVFIGEISARPRRLLDSTQERFLQGVPDYSEVLDRRFKVRRGGLELKSLAFDAATETEFWQATEKAFRKHAAWQQLVPQTTRAPFGPPTADAELSMLSQEALRLYLRGEEGAIPLAQNLVERSSGTLGAGHPQVAAHMANLALLYREQGDFTRAEMWTSRALGIRESGLGPKHPAVAHSLLSLAGVYASQWQFERAAPLVQRSLEIREDSLGSDHPDVAVALSELATCFIETGRSGDAVPLVERAVKILERFHHRLHPDVAAMLTVLGVAYLRAGDTEKALGSFERSLTIRERAYGADAPEVAETLLRMASLHQSKGDYEAAIRLLGRVLRIYEQAYGPDDWRVADLLLTLAQYNQRVGASRDQVRSLLARSGGARERWLREALVRGSEEQKLNYVAKVGSRHINAVLSFDLQSEDGDPATTELALETLLRWKGRVLDSSAQNLVTLRERLTSEDRALLDELNQLRRDLAALAMTPIDYRDESLDEEARELDVRAQEIEATLSERSAEFRLRAKPVTLEGIQKLLPPHATLVEFARYESPRSEATVRQQHQSQARYAAYVLFQAGSPHRVDLGPASQIEKLAAELRAAVSDPARADFRDHSEALHAAIFRPIKQLVEATEHLLVAPDGALHLVPFAALCDTEGRFVFEDYTLTYLAAGRDLMRLQQSISPREGAWIVADPDFDAEILETTGGEEGISAPATSLRSDELEEVSFSPLPGTGEEARAIAALLENVNVRVGAEATETVLKQRRGPQVLHVASHGFFLDDQSSSAWDEEARRALVLSTASPTTTFPEPFGAFENPLLRSGLALAGANNRASDRDDGLLTALEVLGLDLRGTQLVVLSACETGVGAVYKGEGVFGLRRALILAGSDSQLMSLWKVEDQATQELMEAFYSQLTQGMGGAEALRSVQKQMLARGDYSHPFYWASFIHSGNWRPVLGEANELTVGSPGG